MTGYQKLKKENEELRKALFSIFMLDESNLKKAQKIAAKALYGNLVWINTNETK